MVQDSGSLVWRLGADGNSKGFSGVASAGVDTFDIPSLDSWYTMETLWVENASGGIDQVSNLYAAGGALLFSDTIPGVVARVSDAGQLGAVSFGNGDEDGPLSLIGAVGIDNLEVVPPSEEQITPVIFEVALNGPNFVLSIRGEPNTEYMLMSTTDLSLDGFPVLEATESTGTDLGDGFGEASFNIAIDVTVAPNKFFTVVEGH